MSSPNDLQRTLKSKAKKCSGMTTEEIFSGLWLSVETVTAHLQKILADQTVKEQALRKLLDDGIKEFLNSHRCISSELQIPPWKRDQIREGILKVFDETFPLEQAKVSVDRKQLSELLDTKRKEWKIAYPLKSQEDFNYRVLIDEIFDELMKVLVAGSDGVEPENKKKDKP